MPALPLQIGTMAPGSRQNSDEKVRSGVGTGAPLATLGLYRERRIALDIATPTSLLIMIGRPKLSKLAAATPSCWWLAMDCHACI